MTIQAIHEGGCACGALRFTVKAAPQRVGMCHCMTCRRVSGSPFGVYAIFRRADVEFRGHTQAWESSAEARRHFCALCGSVAYMEYVDHDEIDLPIGAFDETGLYAPDYELWCIHREPWLPADARPEYERDRHDSHGTTPP